MKTKSSPQTAQVGSESCSGMKSAGEAFGGSNPSLPTTDETIPDNGIVSFKLVVKGNSSLCRVCAVDKVSEASYDCSR